MMRDEIKNILKTLKIKHYVKNVIIFLPLLIMCAVTDFTPELVYSFIGIFVSFCFISSSIYIFNDILDIKNDRNHPVKQDEIIASGKITLRTAVMLFFATLLISSLISMYIPTGSRLMIFSYFIIQIFYSVLFRHILFVDVLCIAFGFILRLYAGFFAIEATPSLYLLMTIFFTSCFFTCIKRKTEKILPMCEKTRPILKHLKKNTIDRLISLNLLLAVLFYMLFTFDTRLAENTGKSYSYITSIPYMLILYGIYIKTGKITDIYDPIIYFQKDYFIKISSIFFLISIIAVLTILK